MCRQDAKHNLLYGAACRFLSLCVVHGADGQARICYLEGGYDVNTLRKWVRERESMKQES